MDLETIKALLAEQQTAIMASVKEEMANTLKQVDSKNSGLASSLTKEFKKSTDSIAAQLQGVGNLPVDDATPQDNTPVAEPAPAPKASERLTLKALQTQIEELKNQNAAKEQALALSSRNNKLNSLFQNRKVAHTDKAVKAFLMDNESNIKQEDGVWFVQNGEEVKSLDDAVGGFLESDFGSMFQQASKGKGLGLKPSTQAPAGKQQEMSLNQALLQVEE